MSAPASQLDADWGRFGWDECIVCGGAPTFAGYTQLLDFMLATPMHRRPTFVRMAWCDAPACIEDRCASLVVPREDASRVVASLAYAVHVAEREAS